MLNLKEKYLKNYINGELVEPSTQNYIENYNPATGLVYNYYPDATENDINHAVESAKNAFQAWRITLPEIRSRIMLRIADIMEQHIDELAHAESIDNGKPMSVAKSIDIPMSIKQCRFFGVGAMGFGSKFHAMQQGTFNYTLHKPMGITSCILPWNSPLYALTKLVIPALALGNCAIIKPSQNTPLTAYLFSQICIDAGLPPGVVNIIYGKDEKVNPILGNHKDIQAYAYAGSIKKATDLAQIVLPRFKKLFIEAGGKNPNIIFGDCNFDEMMRNTLRSSFYNQGQTYFCNSRIFVEDSIYEKFKNEFIIRTQKLTVGDPLSSRTRQGAIGSRNHYTKILEHLADIESEGGKLLTGGKSAMPAGDRCKNGWFIEPTVFEGLPVNAKSNYEPIHSPIVTLTPFKNLKQVQRYLDKDQQGLAASIWTEDINKGHLLARKLSYANIWINGWQIDDLRVPEGAIKSGIGRMGGEYSYEFYTEPKNVCIKA